MTTSFIERQFPVSKVSKESYKERKANNGQIREGNTRATAVFAVKYLRAKGYEVTNDLFKDKSFYFRNALVRANYENQRLNVEKTRLPLEEFFKVLLFGYDLELKNRFLRIGHEYGTRTADAIGGLHRSNRVKLSDDVANVGINVGINETEERAVKLFLRNPKLTAAQLGELLKVEKRHAERIVAALKKKAGLRRRGARKNGEWYFECDEG